MEERTVTQVQSEEEKAAMRKDLFDKNRTAILDNIVKELKSGSIPWHGHSTQGPEFGASGIPISGMNAHALEFAAKEKGFTDLRVVTLQEANNIGYSIKEGAKGTRIESWRTQVEKDENGVVVKDKDGKVQNVKGANGKTLMIPETRVVFFMEQLDPAPTPRQPKEPNYDLADKILDKAEIDKPASRDPQAYGEALKTAIDKSMGKVELTNTLTPNLKALREDLSITELSRRTGIQIPHSIDTNTIAGAEVVKSWSNSLNNESAMINAFKDTGNVIRNTMAGIERPKPEITLQKPPKQERQVTVPDFAKGDIVLHTPFTPKGQLPQSFVCEVLDIDASKNKALIKPLGTQFDPQNPDKVTKGLVALSGKFEKGPEVQEKINEALEKESFKEVTKAVHKELGGAELKGAGEGKYEGKVIAIAGVKGHEHVALREKNNDIVIIPTKGMDSKSVAALKKAQANDKDITITKDSNKTRAAEVTEKTKEQAKTQSKEHAR